MRIFTSAISLLMLGAFPVIADSPETIPCALKNTVFCGQWVDTQGFGVVITGDSIIFNGPIPCTVMKEGQLDDGRPVSLVKCMHRSNTHTRHQPATPTPTGYLFVPMPREGIYASGNLGIWMYPYYSESDLAGPCFSDDVEKKKSCNLTIVYENRSGWSSLYAK